MPDCFSVRTLISLFSHILLLITVATVEAKNDREDPAFFQFRTRPDIQAPRWNITTYHSRGLAPGYWFVAPYRNLEARERGEAWIGPHIYDQKGELIWSGSPTFDHYKAFDLRIAQVNGTDMLTAIYPHENAARILDNTYAVVKSVVHSSSWNYSNMHDFNVVEDGTRALVLTKDAETQLSREMSETVGYHGRCNVRADGLKYLDITVTPPQELMTWNATDHIGVDETVTRPADNIEVLCDVDQGWDTQHTNSIDRFPDGDFLLSARSTSTLYKISHLDGEVVWRLGGKKSDFTFGSEAIFGFQHHARVQSQNATHTVISLMDNAEYGPDDKNPSRDRSAGIILSLDTNNMKADLVAQFKHPQAHDGYTWKRGSAHVQPNGNMFMGWADDMLISEYSPDGKMLMEAQSLAAVDSYRCYKFSWVGQPSEPPNVYSAAFVAGANNVTTMVYMSWNGATEVESWRLYEADADGKLKKFLAQAPRRGFETLIEYNGFAPYVVAFAVDYQDKSLGESRPTQTISPVEGVLDVVVEDANLDPTSEGMETSIINLDEADKAPPSSTASQNSDGGSSWRNHSFLDILIGAILGCLATGIVIALIHYIRSSKDRRWWTRKDQEYEPLTRQDDHEQEDEWVGSEKV